MLNRRDGLTIRLLRGLLDESVKKNSEVWLTIAYKKELEVLIEKYMSRFDNRRESKKYNGTWY